VRACRAPPIDLIDPTDPTPCSIFSAAVGVMMTVRRQRPPHHLRRPPARHQRHLCQRSPLDLPMPRRLPSQRPMRLRRRQVRRRRAVGPVVAATATVTRA